MQTVINNKTCDANVFNGMVATLEKSKTRERLSVTLHVRFFNPLNAQLNPTCYLLALLGAHHILHVSRVRVNLALAGGEPLVLIRSQQIQPRGRAPIFTKYQLPGSLGGCRFSDRRQYRGSLSRMCVPSLIFIGWPTSAYLGHCCKRS